MALEFWVGGKWVCDCCKAEVPITKELRKNQGGMGRGLLMLHDDGSEGNVQANARIYLPETWKRVAMVTENSHIGREFYVCETCLIKHGLKGLRKKLKPWDGYRLVFAGEGA